MVSAFSAANKVVLGQIKTSEKSNEITAIPKLLELLELKGCLIIIDAMGCQREIADKIVHQEADYLLAVKDNQGKLAMLCLKVEGKRVLVICTVWSLKTALLVCKCA